MATDGKKLAAAGVALKSTRLEQSAEVQAAAQPEEDDVSKRQLPTVRKPTDEAAAAADTQGTTVKEERTAVAVAGDGPSVEPKYQSLHDGGLMEFLSNTRPSHASAVEVSAEGVMGGRAASAATVATQVD